MTGVAPETVIVSATSPTDSWASIGTLVFAMTSISSRASVLKPGSVKVTV